MPLIAEAEIRHVHRNGGIVWGRVRVSLVRDAGGKPLYFVVHVEDITERKRAEEALSESEDRFRVMADGCPTMLWVTNPEGGAQFIKRTYREFCGTTLEQVSGGKWQLLVHPEDAHEFTTHLSARWWNAGLSGPKLAFCERMANGGLSARMQRRVSRQMVSSWGILA
jgi:PAS domain-containing protein